VVGSGSVSRGQVSPDGDFIKEYLIDEPVMIQKIASQTWQIENWDEDTPLWEKEDDRPCFIVKWRSITVVSPPIISSAVYFLNINDLDSFSFSFEGLNSTQGTVLK